MWGREKSCTRLLEKESGMKSAQQCFGETVCLEFTRGNEKPEDLPGNKLSQWAEPEKVTW